ncbi:MAG: glutathione S-transferase family protein [Kofleriaceae bacterium]
MSLVFHYSPYSTAAVTHLVLEELGVPYQKVRVDLAAGGTRTPEFLRLNPNGRVPVLVHDGQPLFESAALTLYLGETFGVKRGLYPAPGPTRGRAMQWVVWSNVTLTEAVQRSLIASSPRSPAERHNAAVDAWAREDLTARLDVLDGALASSPFVLGDDYSIVDAHLASTVGWARMLELVPVAQPHVEAWLARCRQRPAYARVMAD